MFIFILNRVLLDQWIRAKYERLEFFHVERLQYTSGYMEGFLMKKGKEDHRYQLRKFILSESDDTLKYHVKESKEPKAVLRISELNVAFAPAKIEHNNSMQITFLKDGSTRHIYVYHDDPEVINNWYMAIRCAKLHRLQVAFPSASESDLIGLLSHDFAKEGWIFKTGPRQSDGYKRRWFTLDNRKLMYHDDQLDAYPKVSLIHSNNSILKHLYFIVALINRVKSFWATKWTGIVCVLGFHKVLKIKDTVLLFLHQSVCTTYHV